MLKRIKRPDQTLTFQADIAQAGANRRISCLNLNPDRIAERQSSDTRLLHKSIRVPGTPGNVILLHRQVFKIVFMKLPVPVPVIFGAIMYISHSLADHFTNHSKLAHPSPAHQPFLLWRLRAGTYSSCHNPSLKKASISRIAPAKSRKVSTRKQPLKAQRISSRTTT